MQVVTRAQVAARLNISPSTVSLWVKKGLIPGVIPNTRRFDLDAIHSQLDKKLNKSDFTVAAGASEEVAAKAALLKWFKDTGHEI